MLVACLGKMPRFLGCRFSSLSSFLGRLAEECEVEEVSGSEEGSSRLADRVGDRVDSPVDELDDGLPMIEFTVLVTVGRPLSRLDRDPLPIPPPADETDRSISVPCPIDVADRDPI